MMTYDVEGEARGRVLARDTSTEEVDHQGVGVGVEAS